MILIIHSGSERAETRVLHYGKGRAVQGKDLSGLSATRIWVRQSSQERIMHIHHTLNSVDVLYSYSAAVRHLASLGSEYSIKNPVTHRPCAMRKGQLCCMLARQMSGWDWRHQAIGGAHCLRPTPKQVKVNCRIA